MSLLSTQKNRNTKISCERCAVPIYGKHTMSTCSNYYDEQGQYENYDD